jgi:hypothetical protein
MAGIYKYKTSMLPNTGINPNAEGSYTNSQILSFDPSSEVKNIADRFFTELQVNLLEQQMNKQKTKNSYDFTS